MLGKKVETNEIIAKLSNAADKLTGNWIENLNFEQAVNELQQNIDRSITDLQRGRGEANVHTENIIPRIRVARNRIKLMIKFLKEAENDLTFTEKNLSKLGFRKP